MARIGDNDENGAVSGDSRSNVEVVYQQLREAILEGDLAAGTRLSQVQLAARSNMSRGPLREALRLLEREGLIVTEHQRMVRVAPVSFADLDELYALRIVNESMAVSASIPYLTTEDVAELQLLLKKMEDTYAADDWTPWRAHHRAFHLGLYQHAGSRTTRFIRDLFAHTERYRRMYARAYYSGQTQAPDVAAAEHRDILDASAAGDREGASQLLARHLARTALTLFALAAPEHDPILVREAVKFVTKPSEPAPARGGRGRAAARDTSSRG